MFHVKDGEEITLDGKIWVVGRGKSCSYRCYMISKDSRFDCNKCPITSRCTGGLTLQPFHAEESVEKPDYYQKFGIDANEIIFWVLNHPDNADKTPQEIACMHSELKYRLRAGFKTEDFTKDMNKAMNYNKQRK